MTLDGSMAKTRQRRIVKLSGNAIAWLTDYAVKKPVFTSSNFQRDFTKVKNAAGFNCKEGTKGLRPWVADYMRHTAISNILPTTSTRARQRAGQVTRQTSSTATTKPS